MISPPASSAAQDAAVGRTSGRAQRRARSKAQSEARSRARVRAETLPCSWDAALDELPRTMLRGAVAAGVVILASMILATLVAVHLGAHSLIYPRPAIRISLADTGYTLHPGDTLQFSARANAGRQLSYTWDFGDGILAHGTQVSHAYTAYGYYAVTCEAVDPTGQRTSAQLAVTVVPAAPRARVSVTHDPAYDYMVTANGSASTGADLHYFWDFGDGASSSSGLAPQATHYYPHPGTYGLTLTVVDVAGQSDMATVQVTVSSAAFH